MDTSNACAETEMPSAINCAIIRRLVNFLSVDVHFACEDRITSPIRDVSIANFINPVPWLTGHTEGTAADDYAVSVSTPIKIRSEPNGTRRNVTVVAAVVSGCTTEKCLRPRTTARSCEFDRDSGNLCGGSRSAGGAEIRGNRPGANFFGVILKIFSHIPIVCEVSLLKIGENAHEPAGGISTARQLLWITWSGNDSSRRKAPNVIMKLNRRECDLFEVVLALGASGSLTSLLYGRENQRHQNADNCDCDEQFDGRKTSARHE